MSVLAYVRWDHTYTKNRWIESISQLWERMSRTWGSFTNRTSDHSQMVPGSCNTSVVARPGPWVVQLQCGGTSLFPTLGTDRRHAGLEVDSSSEFQLSGCRPPLWAYIKGLKCQPAGYDRLRVFKRDRGDHRRRLAHDFNILSVWCSTEAKLCTCGP